MDPEKKKDVDRLLKRILKEECCLLSMGVPLTLVGSLQEFTSPFFIGKSLEAMED